MANAHLKAARFLLDESPPAGDLDLSLQLKQATDRLYGVVRQMLEYLEDLDKKADSAERS